MDLDEWWRWRVAAKSMPPIAFLTGVPVAAKRLRMRASLPRFAWTKTAAELPKTAPKS